MDGEGKSLRVLGFGSNQRASFLKLLMMYGAGDGSWLHFAQCPLTASLRSKHFESLIAYPAFFFSICILLDLEDMETCC